MKPVRNLLFVPAGLGRSSFSRYQGWKLEYNKAVNFQIEFHAVEHPKHRNIYI